MRKGGIGTSIVPEPGAVLGARSGEKSLPLWSLSLVEETYKDSRQTSSDDAKKNTKYAKGREGRPCCCLYRMLGGGLWKEWARRLWGVDVCEVQPWWIQGNRSRDVSV